MAYVRKADRKQEETTVSPVNNTGLENACDIFTAEELKYVNVLAAIFDNYVKTEGEGKRSRVGNFHGLYEVGFNNLNPIVAKLRSQLLEESQWEAAERLLVAHGYVVTFGMM